MLYDYYYYFGDYLFDNTTTNNFKIIDKTNNFVNQLSIEVPGYSKDDLTISVKKDFILIQGDKEGFKKINKSIPIDINIIDIEKSKATVENGIMNIKFVLKKPDKDIQEYIQIE
jgi:HSP20 family molecular chaperone IbpA